MPRSSKGTSALSKLRKELNGITQLDLATAAGLHRRTIQEIERGKPISRRNALRISGATGVSVSWLLRNNPNAPVRNLDEKLWSDRDRQSFEKLAERPQLGRAVRRFGLAIYTGLLGNYLMIRRLIESAPDSTEAFFRWTVVHTMVVTDFVNSYRKDGVQLAMPKFDMPTGERMSKENLQSIKDDIEAVIEQISSTVDGDALLMFQLARLMAKEAKDSSTLEVFAKLPDGEDPLPKLLAFMAERAPTEAYKTVFKELQAKMERRARKRSAED